MSLQPGGGRRPTDPARRRPRHPLPRPRGARGAAAGGARRLARPDRAGALPDGGDDRAAPGRAGRASLAGRRLGAGVVRVRRSYTRGRVHGAEEPALEPRGAARRPARARSSSATSSARAARATTTSSSPTRRPAAPTTPRRCESASRRRSRRAGLATAPLPRPAPHLRHADGGRRRAAARAPGVDGPPRLQDDRDLRRLRARPLPGARYAARAFGSGDGAFADSGVGVQGRYYARLVTARQLTFVSAYSGAGGLDLGFIQAGFAPVWANEWDPDAAGTYERNLRHRQVGDITGLELPERGSADVVVGGPPCQGFSVAGHMDPRTRAADTSRSSSTRSSGASSRPRS